jgi:hypothetical protein
MGKKKNCNVVFILVGIVILLSVSLVSAFPLGSKPIPGHYGWQIANGSISGFALEDNLNMTGNVSINDLFYVKGDNVGIGTGSPGSKLHIYKTDSVNNTVIELLRLERLPSSGGANAGIGSSISF